MCVCTKVNSLGRRGKWTRILDAERVLMCSIGLMIDYSRLERRYLQFSLPYERCRCDEKTFNHGHELHLLNEKVEGEDE